ncbi:MAG: polyprenyl synthetase family protein [Verrucomicrobiota bacterium]
MNSLTEKKLSPDAPKDPMGYPAVDLAGGEPLDPTLPLKLAFEPIAKQLLDVEERIRAQARAFDPAVEHYVAYAIQSSGKRLRPALALLSGGATGGIRSEHVDLAVIVELIHAATLVHDDILDHADLRRGQPTANAKWGNSLAVLLGDCLFAHALRLASVFDDNRMCRTLATAASEVCSGEIIQTQRRFDLNLTVPDYFRILEMKTGALFAVAMQLGGLLNGASPEVEAGMQAFGMRLGTAYQIYDDCLDLAGDEGAVGKTLGSDLRRGKLTLPILHLLQISSPEERARLSGVILAGREEEVSSLVGYAVEYGAVRHAVTTGRRMLVEAQESLAPLVTGGVSGAFVDSLVSLCTTLDGMIAPLAR